MNSQAQLQSQSQASQGDSSSSARFSGLINPIRDLALNWDVDIAHTLEDYLDELDHIRLPAPVLPLLMSPSAGSEGGGGGGSALQNLNFAEAALLIQGSTCVYSKKVEHLHNLVFQALELISANKEGGADKKDKHGNVVPGAGGGGEDEALLWGDDPSFLLLDDAFAVLPGANQSQSQSLQEHQELELEQGEQQQLQEQQQHDMFALGSGGAKYARRKSRRLSLASDISRTSRASIVLMNSILHDDQSFAAGGAGGSSTLKMASCAMNNDGALVFAASAGGPLSRRSSMAGTRGSGAGLSTQGGGSLLGSSLVSGAGPGDLDRDRDVPSKDFSTGLDDSNGGMDYDDMGGGGPDYSDDEDQGGGEWGGGEVDHAPDGSGEGAGSEDKDRGALDTASVLTDDSHDPHAAPLFNPLALLDPYEVEDSRAGVGGRGRAAVSRPVKTDRRTYRLPPPSAQAAASSSAAASSTRSSGNAVVRKKGVLAASVANTTPTSLFDFHRALALKMASSPSSISKKRRGDADRLDAALALSTAAVCKPSNLLRVADSFQEVASRRARAQNQLHADYHQRQQRVSRQTQQQTHGQQYYSDDLGGGGGWGGDDDDDEYVDMGGGGDFEDDDDGPDYLEDGDGEAYSFPRLSVGSTGGGGVVGGGEEAQLARRVEAQLALSALGGSEVGALLPSTSSGGSGSYGYGDNTFENLCRQHISSFMRGAEEYARETNLSRRVTAWTLRLEPLLLEQESRPVFDIHDYSDRALRRVTSKVAEQKSEKGEKDEDELKPETESSPSGGDEAVVHFSSVVGGESSTEVCRLFLACLQLANLGNLSFDQSGGGGVDAVSKGDISSANSKKMPSAVPCAKSTRDISDFGVHLLDGASNRLDINTYRAPSAQLAADEEDDDDAAYFS